MANIGHNNPPLNGYVLIARKLLNHPVVGAGKPVKPAKKNKPTYSRMEAWLDLLMLASYQDKKTKVGDKIYQLEVGEAVCARAYLAARWNWSDKTVRAFIEKLMGHSMVTKTREAKGQQANKLSICNYSEYQRPSPEMGQERGQQKGQKKGQQENELTYCKSTINMFPEYTEGQLKGPTKGPHIKETKINKKDICPTEKSKAQIALDEYNQLAERAGLSRVKVLSKSRLTSLTARLKEHGLNGWRQALENVERSSFLCGDQKGQDWKASFDFLLQQSSFLKVIEGQYGNGRVRKPQISPERAKELREKYKAPPPIISEDAR